VIKHSNNYITTYSGKKFFFPELRFDHNIGETGFFDIDPEQIDIYDIAHALAQLNRFNGHLERPYNVAQHCCLVSDMLPHHPLEGLLHDAAEAYTGDFPTPVKRLIPELYELEATIMKAVAIKFDLTWPLPPCVEVADKEMLKREFPLFEAPTHDLIPWSWSRSKIRFLDRYNTLVQEREYQWL